MFPLSPWLGRDDEGVLSRALLAISHNPMRISRIGFYCALDGHFTAGVCEPDIPLVFEGNPHQSLSLHFSCSCS